MRKRNDGNAFLHDPKGRPMRARDDLVEILAEEYVASATSGEDVGEELRDEVVPEELGSLMVQPIVDGEAEDALDAQQQAQSRAQAQEHRQAQAQVRAHALERGMATATAKGAADRPPPSGGVETSRAAPPSGFTPSSTGANPGAKPFPGRARPPALPAPKVRTRSAAHGSHR